MANRIRQLLTLQACVFVLLTANVWSQEAPLGFDSQNGLVPAKQFVDARQAFEEVETPQKGLGIRFNEASCATCHVAPGPKYLPGGSGPIAEIRAGFVGAHNELFLPPRDRSFSPWAKLSSGRTRPDRRNPSRICRRQQRILSCARRYAHNDQGRRRC